MVFIKLDGLFQRAADGQVSQRRRAPAPLVGTIKNRPISPAVIDETQAGRPIFFSARLRALAPAVNFRTDFFNFQGGQVRIRPQPFGEIPISRILFAPRLAPDEAPRSL